MVSQQDRHTHGRPFQDTPSQCTTTLIHSPPEMDRTGESEKAEKVRQMFHVKHVTVRQVCQAAQCSGETGETGGQWLRRHRWVRRDRSQARQARQALRRSVAQVCHIAVGAPHTFGTSLCKKRAILF